MVFLLSQICLADHRNIDTYQEVDREKQADREEDDGSHQEDREEDDFCRDAQLNILSTFINEVSHSHYVFAVHPQSLKRKCVMVKSKYKMYVIPLPNNVERD